MTELVEPVWQLLFKNMFDPINRIHINYSTDRASDGTIIRSSIMVNLYEDSVEKAVDLYKQLKEQLTAIDKDSNPRVSREMLDFPECPDHKVKMFMRTRKSDGGIFFGCPMYGSNGCKKTVQFPLAPKENIQL